VKKNHQVTIEGPSYSSVWKWQIIGHAKLPRQFLMPDAVKIQEYVQSMKSEACIDGVEIYEDVTFPTQTHAF